MTEPKDQSPGQTIKTDDGALPVLPLRDIVFFPGMTSPIYINRQASADAVTKAFQNGKEILVLTQKDPEMLTPGADDLYDIGTICTIAQVTPKDQGITEIVLQGLRRAKASVNDNGGNLTANVWEQKDDLSEPSPGNLAALTNIAIDDFVALANKSQRILPGLINYVEQTRSDPSKIADVIATNLPLNVSERQEILSEPNVTKRLESVISHIAGTLTIAEAEGKIRERVKQSSTEQQREHFLRTQMEAIRKELGEGDADAELAEIEERIKAKDLSDEAREKAEKELKKLRAMPPQHPETAAIRNWLDSLLDLPWGTEDATETNKDISAAEEILDEDHYGLQKVKERILEFLAVQNSVGDIKGPILCLAGPPGVGKTSLGKSIARATNRKFVRMALGGVRDEAEIRGHRRTYIGALPGKIIRNMEKAGSTNPFFLLDELDKMGTDFRGDPASAMLEVLDPEQNHSFQDHYLEVDYDLSKVFFVATANYLEKVPEALKDRMEIIQLPGYTEDEKLHIATKHLLPKQREATGLKENDIDVQDSAIIGLIRYYTREAGVRNLEREIGNLCRKAVMKRAKTGPQKVTVSGGSADDKYTGGNLTEFAGTRKYSYGLAKEKDVVGSATGLAWTAVGGEILEVQSETISAKGFRVKITGQLGDVMKESSEIAQTVIRKTLDGFGIDFSRLQDSEVHVHVPAGATPKDGPSAGITFVTSGISSLTNIPVRRDVGMTGEVDIKGNVLPIGGLKEKLIAARRAGLTKILIPEKNEKDLEDVPENIKADLNIMTVKTIDEVLGEALTEPLSEKALAKIFVKASEGSEEEKPEVPQHELPGRPQGSVTDSSQLRTASEIAPIVG